MAVKTYNPITPGQRFKTSNSFADLTPGATPEKGLTTGLTKSCGRNNQGRRSMRYIGGGHKQLYRIVDFKRNHDGVPATVKSIEYDPNRSAFIALLWYADGTKSYIIAPKGLKVGAKVMSGEGAAPEVGNTLFLKEIPLGTEIHCIEMEPGAGANMATYAYQVEVLKAKNSNVIFSRTFHGNKLKSPFICSDSVQIADFNFDGYPDFRVCALGSNHIYYVYYKKSNTFIEEKRLSELINVVFDYNKKLVTGNKNIVNYDMGVHTRTIKVSLSAEELSKHKSTDDNNVQQPEPVVVPINTIPKKDSVVVVRPKKIQ